MASLPDVEEAMVQLVADCLALGHNYIPGSTVSSPVAGTRCRVYRGWPKSATLNSDLKDGATTITVFPVAGSTRRVTKYFPEWRSLPSTPPTMTVDVDGAMVTFGGRGGGVGQVAAVMARDAPVVDPFAQDFSSDFGSQPFTPGATRVKNLYACRVGFSDTPSGIAGTIGALIPNAVVNGSSIRLPTSLDVDAVIVSDALSYLETRRQQQNIWLTTWSPRPRDRDIVSSVVDDGLANMMDQYGRLTYEFGLPDGSNGQIRYISSHTDDVPQQDNLWRKDLRYMIEYPTTITEHQPVVVAVGGSLSLTNVDFSTVFGIQLP